jgi:hypothetical protein
MINTTLLTDTDHSAEFLLCIEYERDNLDIEYVNTIFHRLEQIGEKDFRIRLDPATATAIAAEMIAAAYDYLEILLADQAVPDQNFRLEVVF